MNLQTNLLRSIFRPRLRPRYFRTHRLVPEVSGLEDRKLMATMDSVAFSSILNTQVNDIVYGNGELVEVRASLLPILQGGPTTTVLDASGVKSVGVAFNPISGALVRTVVMTNGAAYQNGVFQGMGVEDETVTFTATGSQVNSVVYSNGQLYQFDSSGAHLLGGNVLSASLAYDKLGNAVEDIVFTNDVLVEYDGYNSSAHVLASNVVSVGVAIGTVFGEVQEIVYSNGEEFQDSENPVLGSITLGILGPNQHDNGKIF